MKKFEIFLIVIGIMLVFTPFIYAVAIDSWVGGVDTNQNLAAEAGVIVDVGPSDITLDVVEFNLSGTGSAPAIRIKYHGNGTEVAGCDLGVLYSCNLTNSSEPSTFTSGSFGTTLNGNETYRFVINMGGTVRSRNNGSAVFPYVATSGTFNVTSGVVNAATNSSHYFMVYNITTLGDELSNITALSPADSFSTLYNNITFVCNAQTSKAVVNVSFYIDGTLNETNTSGATGNYSFPRNVTYGDHNWSCNLRTNTSLSFDTATRTFSISEGFSETAQTFNSTTYETKTETYLLQISHLNNSWTNSAGYLYYNGTTYTGTRQGNDNDINFTYTLDIPDDKGNTTQKFWWVVNLTNSTGTYSFNSTNQNQSSDLTSFGLCNASLTTPYLNITFKDETDSSLINGTVDTSTFNYWLGTGTEFKTLLFTNTTANDWYAFCASPNTFSYQNNITIQYASDGYPQRRWFYDDALPNTTYEKTLYLLATANGIYSVYQVQNNAGSPIQGVEVTAERQISGVWTLLEQSTTDSAGAVTFWLNPNFDHRLIFTKSGYVTQTLTIRPSSSTYTVTMSTTAQAGFNTSIEGITWTFSPKIGQTLLKNNIYDFWFNITSYNNSLTRCKIEITDNNGTILNQTTGCSASGGNISVHHNITSYDQVFGRYSINTGDGYFVIDSDAYWITITSAVDSNTRTLWNFLFTSRTWSGLGGESKRAEFTSVVLFFLIFTIAWGLICLKTGWDVGNPGGVLWILFLTTFVASLAGFLTLNGATSFDFLDKYICTFIIFLFSAGYTLNHLRRNTE